MNSGTIAGLTSAPLKTKGWNNLQKTITSSNSIALVNNVPGAVTITQQFPNFTLSGNGYNTAGLYSRNLKFKLAISPIASTNDLNSGTFSLSCSINNAAYTNLITTDSQGSTTFLGGIATYAVTGNQGRVNLDQQGGVSIWSFGYLMFNSDSFLTRGSAAANLRQGANSDVAAPISQTFSVQNVLAGTSNTAGVARNIDGCQGTGTGSGGSIVFRTAAAGTAGTAQNALTATLTISPLATTITNEAKIERAAVIETSSTSIQLDVTNYAGMVINCTSSSAVTITLPTTNVPLGYNVVVIRSGTGTITFVEGTVTVGGAANVIRSYSGFKSIDSYSSASLICLKSGSSGVSAEYSLSGGLLA